MKIMGPNRVHHNLMNLIKIKGKIGNDYHHGIKTNYYNI